MSTATKSSASVSRSKSSALGAPSAPATLLKGPIPSNMARRPKVATTTGGNTHGKNVATATAAAPEGSREQERESQADKEGETCARDGEQEGRPEYLGEVRIQHHPGVVGEAHELGGHTGQHPHEAVVGGEGQRVGDDHQDRQQRREDHPVPQSQSLQGYNSPLLPFTRRPAAFGRWRSLGKPNSGGDCGL